MNLKPSVCTIDELSDPEAEAFCRANDLGPYLAEIQSLARKYFPDAPPVVYRLEEDPEYDGQCLEAAIVAPRDPRVASEMYDRFTDEWVNRAPAPIRERIRFAYMVA
jgi:hypothetical protein